MPHELKIVVVFFVFLALVLGIASVGEWFNHLDSQGVLHRREAGWMILSWTVFAGLAGCTVLVSVTRAMGLQI